MELIFIWIGLDKRSLFNDQVITFSNKFLVEYNYISEEICIKKNDNYINVYSSYESISNITAIVGNNGAGKTSLLKYIIDFFVDDNKLGLKKSIYKGLLGLYDKLQNQIYIYQFRTPIEKVTSENIKVKLLNLDNNPNLLIDNLNILFLSNSTDIEIRESLGSFININARSVIETLQSYFNDKEKYYGKWDSRSFEELLYLKYFCYLNQNNIKFCGKTYDEVEVAILSYYEDLGCDRFIKHLDGFEKIYNLLCSEKTIYTDSIVDSLIKNLIYSFLAIINSKNISNTYNENFVFKIVNSAISVISKYCCNIHRMRNNSWNLFYNDLLSCFEKLNNNEIFEIKKNIHFIIKFLYLYEKGEIHADNRNEDKFSISPELLYPLLIDENNDVLHFATQCLTICNFYFSSGEKALLNFFAWINGLNILTKVNANFSANKNYLIIIDEIDLYAHPLWQRQLLKSLLFQLCQEFKNKNIQLVFTTHSPMLLTDVPKNNTIYIKKNSNYSEIISRSSREQTFGANIYDLYNDAFFLEDSFIGDVAENFIKQIINDINLLDIDINKNIYNRISLVGDKLAQYKLLLMYKEKFKLL